jgi:hypothetical protein
MTTHIRNLVQDLVERRLWPVALLLAVALAAVPVVLGRGGEDAAPTAALPATPAPGAATAEQAEVSLDTSAPADRDRGGPVRNPFKAPASHAPKAAPTTASASSDAGTGSVAGASAAPSPGSTSASGASSTGDAGSSAGTTETTTPASDTTTTTPETKPKTTHSKPTADDASDTYHVSLRIRVNGGEVKTIRDVARLSALPSVTDPFFVFLGVIETKTTHEKRAVFIVSSDTTPNGEGACHPTKQDCQTVELTVGQTAFFDYAPPGVAPTQYELELAGIHKTVVHAQAKAAAAFARHSVAGAELLRDAATRNVRAAAGARAYRYLPGIGMLVRAKCKHVTARAAAADALVPGLALLSRKRQPGIPVWRSPKR